MQSTSVALATATPQQLTVGPAPVPRQKPTIAMLAEAMDAFAIRGMCRCIAYELLRYWQPGGTVFPSLTTLAESLGLKPRMARYHLAHLERVGLWKRHERHGTTNIYELMLPRASTKCRPPRQPIAAPPGNPLPVEVTNEVTNVRTKRKRCAACGNSWPEKYGDDCYKCLKTDTPRKPQGWMPTYHDRAARPDPPPDDIGAKS